MTVLAVIPARYGSTRLPGKPLLPLCGKPLIEWVFEGVSACRLVDRVVVATDDERVAEAVTRFGGTAVLTDRTHPSGSDRVAQVARQEPGADVIVNVQGDEPLVSAQVLEALLAPVLDGGAGMSTVCQPLSDPERFARPDVVKVVVDHDGFALYFSRSPIPYRGLGEGLIREHRGLYAFRRAVLLTLAALPPCPLEQAEDLEQLRALYHGVRIACRVVQDPMLEINTPDDVQRFETRCSDNAR